MDQHVLVQKLFKELEALDGTSVQHSRDTLEIFTNRCAHLVVRIFSGDTSKQQWFTQWLESIRSDTRYFDKWGYSEDQWFWQKEQLLAVLGSIEDDIEMTELNIESKDNTVSIRGTSLLRKNNASQSSRIFVVHGQDNEMKQSVARLLERLGLEPIILHEQPSRGKTLIEKFLDYADVGFAIILLSPDDLGRLRSLPNDNLRPRARQNVIFELGFFIGRLGRERSFTLYREEKDFEFPSDYAGVLYVPFDAQSHWQVNLVRELKLNGYKVSLDNIF